MTRLKKYQLIKREFINRCKLQPCSDCKVQYNPWIMQFDHRNPYEKCFNISEKKNSFGYERLKQEIAKCDVVCANCHANRTYRRRNEA